MPTVTPAVPVPPRRSPLASVRRAALVAFARVPLALGYHRAEVRVWLERQPFAQGLSRAQLDRLLSEAAASARAMVRDLVVATSGAAAVEMFESELGALTTGTGT